MFGSNSKIRLLLALVAALLFLGLFAVSALTIRTSPPKNTAAEEVILERPKSAEKNIAGRKGGHLPYGVRPKKESTPTPSATSSSDEAADINMISLVGTIVSILGTILSVWIAWLTYQQGKRTEKA